MLGRIQGEREGAYHLSAENTNEDYVRAVFEQDGAAHWRGS